MKTPTPPHGIYPKANLGNGRNRLTTWVTESVYSTGIKGRLLRIGLYLLLPLPVIAIATYTYVNTRATLTNQTLERRQAITTLAATVMTERLDRLIDVGNSLATRVAFRQHIAEGRWDEAIDIIRSAVPQSRFIERVGLIDPTGTLMADTVMTSEAIGQNFSDRDWYQGVSKNWQPYVSEAIVARVVPYAESVIVSIPIRSDDQQILGILNLQIKLETFADWTRGVDVGPAGIIYVTDQKGHIVVHPRYSTTDGQITDFSSVPSVQRALAGERGIAVTVNPVENVERLSAYEPIKPFGWALVLAEPVEFAFAQRDQTLRGLLITGSLLVLISLAISAAIARTIGSLNTYRQTESLFSESIGDGVISIDRNWKIIRWNKAASVISGWSQAEAIGKPFREIVKFIREEDQTENIAFIEEAMLFKEVRLMEDHTDLIRKDGSHVPVADSSAPILDTRGEVIGNIIVFRDVSKERELEGLREEFSSLVAHQLRTPLTAIRGFAAMVLDGTAGTVTDEQREFVTDIATASQRLLGLINALVNVGRVESGAYAIEPEPINLVEVAEQALKEVSVQITDKKQNLIKEIAPALPTVSADRNVARLIIQNLLTNASKYTPEDGSITFTIRQEGSDILMRVVDTGYGIPKNQQHKIFTKFFRADNVRRTSAEGTGQGLYMVKTLVDSYGGKIWFESEENKGSTFSVTIPLAGMKRREGMKGLT